MTLNGAFNNTLDEKGRLSFPSRLKCAFSGDALIITRGIEKCLYLFPLEAWKDFSEQLENPDVMSGDWRKLQRHFLGWAVEAEIDKSSRLGIPQSLREYASLTRDVIVMGLGRRIELWDSALYGETQGEDSSVLEEIAERHSLVF